MDAQVKLRYNLPWLRKLFDTQIWNVNETSITTWQAINLDDKNNCNLVVNISARFSSISFVFDLWINSKIKTTMTLSVLCF
ncbi:hypothetical protein BpHYR1_007585 [Brachionus plicatilis]|uniref:Uncharacterized protein n=1 Tax=Brachionus plicatilis TaxID=10195 RepID=A0A3M7R1U8_BRAPC|nr:hypothetical protein BpHYR1_007585 [Brachionus plicatilis]